MSVTSVNSVSDTVALLAEGVDRNIHEPGTLLAVVRSPSSRRAWIEIFVSVVYLSDDHLVALLAEGVDRNVSAVPIALLKLLSPSSRRAWIEMM